MFATPIAMPLADVVGLHNAPESMSQERELNGTGHTRARVPGSFTSAPSNRKLWQL